MVMLGFVRFPPALPALLVWIAGVTAFVTMPRARKGAKSLLSFAFAVDSPEGRTLLEGLGGSWSTSMMARVFCRRTSRCG